MEAMDSRQDEQYCCTKCLALTGTLDGLKAACSEGGYPYWSSKEELRSNAQKCSLCKVIWEARSWRSNAFLGGLRIHADLEVSVSEETADPVNIDHPLKNRALSGFTLRNPGRLQSLEWLHAFTPQDDPASAIVSGRPGLTDVGGEIALEQARVWLSACENLHTRCSIGRETTMPARVLSVGSDRAAPYICLQSTSGQTGTYIALSYCWGCASQPITTKSNLADRERQVLLKNLPRTIQDAVYITRSLNVQFLWVDALCIVQDDDQERQREIRNMGNIYKNALLTIAAMSSASVNEGFLQKRIDPMSVHLPMPLSEGVIGSVRIARSEYLRLDKEPLNSRGWTLQEHLLSCRMLLYTKHEMLWQCNTHDLVPVQKSHLRSLNYLPNLPLQVFQIPVHDSLNVRMQQIKIWPEIMYRYSHRTLSLPSDRFNALAGIATELSAVWKDVYILGLWFNTFIRNLAWERTVVGAQRDRLPGIPTWSWLSLNCHTEMWPLLLVEDAELLSRQHMLLPIITLEDLADDRMAIDLRARVLDGVSFNKKRRYTTPRMDTYDSQSLDPDLFVALLGYGRKNQGGLCLVLRSINHDRFERVGKIRSWEMNWEEIPYRNFTLR